MNPESGLRGHPCTMVQTQGPVELRSGVERGEVTWIYESWTEGPWVGMTV